jgi:hypothetical protein
MELTTASSEALAAELLGALLIVPDAGLGELEFYFGESFATLIEVKDTP